MNPTELITPKKNPILNSRRVGVTNNLGTKTAKTKSARVIRNTVIVSEATTGPPGQFSLAKCQFFMRGNERPQSMVTKSSMPEAFFPGLRTGAAAESSSVWAGVSAEVVSDKQKLLAKSAS